MSRDSGAMRTARTGRFALKVALESPFQPRFYLFVDTGVCPQIGTSFRHNSAMTVTYDAHHSIASLVDQLATLLPGRGETLATSESCTGGMIAAACTDRAGSSEWFERGFVTYSNAAKRDSLGVDAELLERYGAVSEAVVAAMLEGTLSHSLADWAIAVSGVAGPGGGSDDKPVGTVFIGWMERDRAPEVIRYQFEGTRDEVRCQSVVAALVGLRERADAG